MIEPEKASLSAAPGGLKGSRQVIHIDRMCNECGNCASFCPHAGKPYRDKFTVFSAEEDFRDSGNPGFLALGDGGFILRLEDGSAVSCRKGDATMPTAYNTLITAIRDKYPYLVG
jgi:putative selenate reductase